MKIRKTRSGERTVYKYHYADGEVVEIRPRENGVTEQDIKLLHSLDDSEVYYNLKNLRPERTDEEKEKMREFREEWTSNFKNEYGYEPPVSYVDYIVDEAFPKNYNLSLDYDKDGDFDRSKMKLLQDNTKDNIRELFERIREKMEKMTERQREAFVLRTKGLTLEEIGEIMGISAQGVKKHLDNVEKILKNNS